MNFITKPGMRNKVNQTDDYMIATVTVDQNLCISSYTSKATDIFHLMPSHQGQSFEHLSHRLLYDSMIDDVKKVLESSGHVKKRVRSKEGRKFIMKLSPRHTKSNNNKGVVLNFIEIKHKNIAEQKVEEHEKHEKALAEIGIYALQEQNIQSIINKCLEKICSTLNADYSLVLGSGKKSDSYSILGCTAKVEDRFGKGHIEIDKSWDVAYALKKADPFVIEDYRQVEEFSLIPLLDQTDIMSSAYINLGSTRNSLGLLGIYSRQKRNYTEHELNFLQIIANILGSVIEQHRSKHELENANRQLEEEIRRNKLYQKEIQNLNIVERWNLGEYLHDNLGQTLVSAKIILSDIGNRLDKSDIDLTAEIGQVEDIIESGLKGIRDLSHEIVPIDIEAQGVIHAFKHMLKQAEKLHNVNCILETDEITDKIRNRELVTNLYRVAQEAVNNAILNGRATNIKTVIIEHNKQLYLHIKDDGKSIQYSEEEPDELSILIMKHRMELVGGTFRIKKLNDSDIYTNSITCTLPMEALETNGNGNN